MRIQPTTDIAEYRASWNPSEKAFQQALLDAARRLGWLCYHVFDSRRSAHGFPDIICLKGERCLAFELKANKGRVRPEQLAWIEAFGRVPGVTAAVLRPKDYDQALAVLSGETEERAA